MKLTFPLENPPHKPPQVVAAIKNKVRKYLRREAGKKLPDGIAYWDFNCKVSKPDAEPEKVMAKELIPSIDRAAAMGWESITIEITAKPGPALKRGMAKKKSRE